MHMHDTQACIEMGWRHIFFTQVRLFQGYIHHACTKCGLDVFINVFENIDMIYIYSLIYIYLVQCNKYSRIAGI